MRSLARVSGTNMQFRGIRAARPGIKCVKCKNRDGVLKTEEDGARIALAWTTKVLCLVLVDSYRIGVVCIQFHFRLLL